MCIQTKTRTFLFFISTNLYKSMLICKLRIQGSSLISKTSFAGKPHSQMFFLFRAMFLVCLCLARTGAVASNCQSSTATWNVQEFW